MRYRPLYILDDNGECIDTIDGEPLIGSFKFHNPRYRARGNAEFEKEIDDELDSTY